MGIMVVDVMRVEYGDLGGMEKLIGLRLVPSENAPRPGILVNVITSDLYVHPDEERMVWASLGFIQESFRVLNRSLFRQIERDGRHAEEKLRVKTSAEIHNEVSDRLAPLPVYVRN